MHFLSVLLLQEGCTVVEMDIDFRMKYNKEYAFAVQQGGDSRNQMIFACGDKKVFTAWIEFLRKRCSSS